MGSINKQKPVLLFPALCHLAVGQSEKAWTRLATEFTRSAINLVRY